MTAPATIAHESHAARTTGYLLAGLGAALFSTKAIFVKLAFRDDVNATLMLAYRMIFALPLFAAIGIWAWRQRAQRGEPVPETSDIAKAMLAGVFGYYLASYFDFKGLEYISAQLERLVLFTYPMMIMFLSAAVFGERLTRHGLLAAGITYAGLGMAFWSDLPSGGRDTWIGTGFVLLAALAFALHQIYAKRFIGRLGSALYTAISMSTASVLCIAHHAIAGVGTFSASPWFLSMAAGCAVFATVLPVLFINASLARISSTSVAMISTVSPMVTIALAIGILGEPFTWTDALGALMVIAGVALYTVGDRHEAVQASA